MADRAIRLIAGLGNPGAKYDDTRHNAGFWLVDEIARRHGAGFRVESRFHGEVVKLALGSTGPEVWLLKPNTYMNRSGQAVRALAAFYRLAPEEVLVVHDDLDLPPGTVRFKRTGGHGGHNGLKDIHAQLGSRDYRRLRIGIGHPGNAEDVVGYVLRKPPAEERRLIDSAVEAAESQVVRLAEGDYDGAMLALHSR